MRRILIFIFALLALPCFAQNWKFAVSGDSRNCGGVVMPAIAEGAKANDAALYWHLGDFRALFDFDEDFTLVKRPAIGTYQRIAWPDFIKNQVGRFAPIPVYLGIGNHELFGKTRGDYIAQFGDWLTQPVIVKQRLDDKQRFDDDATDHVIKTYYHWIQGGVDFITMDNASYEFDDAQLAWFKKVIAADAKSADVKAVILGMHAALPHSLGCDHSMNETASGEWSGDAVYRQLLDFRATTKKNVYIIASHSHFLMRDIYDSPYWREHGGVLPGIIVGTAGAVRYRLPDTAAGFPPDRAQTDVYGYLLANVDAATGNITFDFKEVKRDDIPADVKTRVGEKVMDFCFALAEKPDGNIDKTPRSSAPCSAANAPCGPTQH
jgi:hypothetical protein